MNGVGRWFSGRYGYGLMDAGHLVVLAKDWKFVPTQRLFIRSVIVDSRYCILNTVKIIIYLQDMHMRKRTRS